MPPAKKRSNAIVKKRPDNEVLDEIGGDFSEGAQTNDTGKETQAPEDEILEDLTDEDLDFSFITDAVEQEEQLEATASPNILGAVPADSELVEANLDEDELADMESAIAENRLRSGGDQIQASNPRAVVPDGQSATIIPISAQELNQPTVEEGDVGTKSPEATQVIVQVVPITAENLQPATEKIAEQFRIMRELIRELNTNLNAIASERLKEVLEKLTIDVQAEEESIKEYNANAANFLAAIVTDGTIEESERTFKEAEIRKNIANIYEEHRECTGHMQQLTDILQSLAEDESLPADQKALLSVLDLTFVIDLAEQQMEVFQGILNDLTIDLEVLLKQKQADATAISDDLQAKIEEEIRLRSEAANLPPVSREDFINYAINKRDRIWYHALWFLVYTVEDHVANKQTLHDALKGETSKSAIDDVKENVFYFGLGPLLKLRLEDQNVLRYRDRTFKLNVKIKEISEILEEIGAPISPRPLITKEAEKDMIDAFLGDDFLDI